MATIQNALQVSNHLPQVINNMPQVINNVPQVINNSPQVLNALPPGDGALTRISNSAMPMIDARSITIQLTQINTLYTQMEREIEEVDAAQERLNKGGAVVGAMMNKVKGLVASVLNFENFKVVIGLSDDMATTQGRLELMNDAYQKQAQEAGVVNTALTSTSALQDMIFDSAQRTFGSYQTTADMVNQLGTAASGAFSSPAEIVAFTEQMNKTMAVAGAPPEAMSSVTQAMTSGTMDSAGLNNLAKQAPAVVGNIQNYLEDVMNIDASNLKQLATEGVITADVIKNAMFYAAEDTNAAFASMPTTWGNIWQNIKTGAFEAFSPILLKINELANSEKIQQVIAGIGIAFGLVAGWAMTVMDLFITIGSFIYDNWSLIAPIVLGLAGVLLTLATYLGIVELVTTLVSVATWLWNAALTANPIVWVIMAVIALVAIFYLIIAAINHFAGTSISATGAIIGAFAVLGAFIWNTVVGVLNAVIQAVWSILVDPWIAIIEWVLNVFNGGFNSFGDAVANLIGQIISWFLTLGKVVTEIIDAIFGTNWTAGLSKLQKSVVKWGKNENAITLDREAPTFDSRIEYGVAWDGGYDFGSGLLDFNKEEKPPEEPPPYVPVELPPMQGPVDQSLAFGDQLNKGNEHSKQIADNTGAMANGVAMMNEDLQYMRDIAEREAINRYTTAEVIVDARSENHINSELDIDGVIDRFGQKVEEVAVGLAESGGVSLV